MHEWANKQCWLCGTADETALQVAVRACLLPCRRYAIADLHGNTIDAGIPAEVAAELQQLMALWNLPDPTPEAKGKRKRDSGDEDDGHDGKGNDNNGGAAKKQSEGPSLMQKLETKHDRRRSERLSKRGRTEQEHSRSDFVSKWVQEIEDPTATSTPVSPPPSSRGSGKSHTHLQHDIGVPPRNDTNQDGKGERANMGQEHWVLGPGNTSAGFMSDVARRRRLDEEIQQANMEAWAQKRKEQEARGGKRYCAVDY